jgi:hypothetical protein
MDTTHSTDSKSQSDWRKREMGALWKKDGKTQQFYSGFIKLNKGTPQEKEHNIVVFLNKMKSSEKAPDLIVYESAEQPSFIDDSSMSLTADSAPTPSSSNEDERDGIPDTFLDS